MENGNNAIVQFSRLVADTESSLLDDGYNGSQAFVEAMRMVVRRFALPVEPHEQRIIDEMREMSRNGKEPVTSLQLAGALSVPHSTMQLYLSELEGRMLINRPWGPKKGWSIVD